MILDSLLEINGYDAYLRPTSKLMYVVLLLLAEEKNTYTISVSINELVRYTGFSKSTIMLSLSNLVEQKLLKKEFSVDKNTGVSLSNTYTII